MGIRPLFIHASKPRYGRSKRKGKARNQKSLRRSLYTRLVVTLHKCRSPLDISKITTEHEFGVLRGIALGTGISTIIRIPDLRTHARDVLSHNRLISTVR